MHIRKMLDKLESEEDYREALTRFLELSCVHEDPARAGELFQLISLLEEYEKENCSM